MEITLRRQTEYYLRTEIGASEWSEAKTYAEQKLKRIIDHEGDEGKTRRETWYLAQLIAEAIRANRFSTFTFASMEIPRNIDNMG